MCPGRTALLMVTPSVLIPPITFFTSISATFAVLDIIFNLWNTTFHRLKILSKTVNVAEIDVKKS